MFAVDTKVYKPIHSFPDSVQSLQNTINLLSQWSKTWQLTFNKSKCNILTVQTKAKHHHHSYTFDLTPLAHIAEEKDLGITIDSALRFKTLIENISSKANKIMGMIRCNFTTFSPTLLSILFKSLVRPILEYGTALWSPHLGCLQSELEKVQHRATKLIPEISDLPYEERLAFLNLPSLSYRRARKDIIQIYKLLHGLYDINHSTLLTLNHHPTRSNGLKLEK